MGLESLIRSKVVDEEGFQLVNSAGQPQAVLVANKTGRGKQTLTSEFEIMRGDLVKILYDVTRERTRYIFGTTVDRMEEVDGDEGVKVLFKDGREEVFDLVVGADGDHSKTRRMILGPKAPEPFRSLGLYICYFTCPRIESDSKFATAYHAVGSRIVATRADNPKTIQVYLAVLATGKGADVLGRVIRDRKAGMKAQKKAWAEAFRDAGWQTERFLEAMLNNPLADDFYGHEIGQVRMDSWSKGRITLLGDAGYCPTLVTGFGTSLAMVGAYVLAGELAMQTKEDGTVDVDAALERYDKTLRPFVNEVQKIPPFVPYIAYPETWWGIKILQTLVWLWTVFRLDKLMSMFGSDDVGTWKLPDYQGLRAAE
jgi:2-polyprenyl-6-methoxyphenol hydroxylase-like FAD-dependent oxidoreductase